MKKKIINIPYLGYKTHTIIYGDYLKKAPLIILHGGPGGCVEKYESLTELNKRYDVPIIMYDQLGSAYSKVGPNHTELWNFDTFMNELDNLLNYLKIKDYYLLGHSWGGMLALQYCLSREHSNLKKLILFSTLPSTKIWNEEHIKMINDFPCAYKEAIMDEYRGLHYDKKIYKKAIKLFYNEHVGKKGDSTYIRKRKRFPKVNKEIYEYMWGKSELFGTGTLKDYDLTNQLKNIDVPTLIISGKYDESTPLMNSVMKKEIKGSIWKLLEHSHHGGYNEEPEEVYKAIIDFLDI